MESNFTRLVVAGVVFHGTAIVCTIFRLVYRCWTRHLWWEDAWAAVSLISDVMCLACIWIYPSSYLPSWFLAVAFTCVLWAARMSIIFCIIRIVNHSGSKVHKRIVYLIAVSFVCMWIALLVQKVYVCKLQACLMSESVALSQLITDVISDFSLVAAPLRLWKNAGLSRSRKILVLSSFGTSILITVMTIPLSVILFRPLTDTTLIFAHARVAVGLIICNVLVIATFAYHALSRRSRDHDQSLTSGIFSTVVITQFPTSAHTRTSFCGQEGAISGQMATRQTKVDDASLVSAEEDINGMAGNMKDGMQ
ncbi:hypothetical protein BDR04DRAFT_1079213 [Suillus decipiens]|nr:hypothetical protein BDR04DRAFT_1079213 [Suillus decipiens]